MLHPFKLFYFTYFLLTLHFKHSYREHETHTYNLTYTAKNYHSFTVYFNTTFYSVRLLKLLLQGSGMLGNGERPHCWPCVRWSRSGFKFRTHFVPISTFSLLISYPQWKILHWDSLHVLIWKLIRLWIKVIVSDMYVISSFSTISLQSFGQFYPLQKVKVYRPASFS